MLRSRLNCWLIVASIFAVVIAAIIALGTDALDATLTALRFA